MSSDTPVVIKIGGSVLQNRDVLQAILNVIDKAQSPIAIVPGGGVFADAVRALQVTLKFDDETAHRLAIVAMHQTGVILARMITRARCVESIAGIGDAWAETKIPIWQPLRELDADRTLPRSWDTTSDAIAARLAARLSDARVVLVKASTVDATRSLATLVEQGVIDPVFPDIVKNADLKFDIIDSADADKLARCLNVAGSVSTSQYARATAPSS